MFLVADQIARAAGEVSSKGLLKVSEDIAQSCQLSARGEIGLGNIHLPEPALFNAQNNGQLITVLENKAADQINYYLTDRYLTLPPHVLQLGF